MPILQDLGINIECVKCEDSPDIQIPNFEGKYIGIEVIECHTIDIATAKKQQIQRGNSRLNAVCKKYAEKCRKKGKSIAVLLEFSPYTYQLLRERKYDKNIESEIIAEIDRHQETDNIRFHIFDERWQQLNEEGAFDYKYVMSATFRENSLSGVCVINVEGKGVKCIEQEYVVNCINEKEAKLQSYKSKNTQINEFWLCIYVDVLEFRSIDDFEIENITTNFDRVYLTTRCSVKRIK